MKLIAAAALVLALVAPAAASSSSGSGLRGLVTKGPITPVCQAGTPCSAPAANVKLTFRHGDVARTVTTNADGRYTLALPAGTYSVTIVPARMGYSPTRAVVPSGRFAVRNFSIDTGIR